MAIIALAAGLRLWRLDLAEFKNDEAGWLRLAEDVVRLGRVPLAGEGTSLHFASPPGFIYFLAPLVALSRDPQVASAAIGVVNVGGVAGTVLLGWRAFSPGVGLAAGLAYATNPWAVFFGRKIWDPDLIAPMTVLLFIALDRGLVERRAAWTAATFPILALTTQLNLSATVLAPVLVAPAIALVRCRRWGHLIAGLVLSVLIVSPYLIHNLRETPEVLILQSALVRAASVNTDSVARVVGITGGWDNWYIEGVHLEFLLPGRIASAPGRLETILLALGVLMAGVLAAAPRMVAESQRFRLAGLLLWLTLPAVLTVRHSVPLYDHYFQSAMPAAALLIGVGIQWVAAQSRSAGILLTAALIGIAVIQVVLVLRELEFLTVSYAFAYGPPLARSEAMARDVVSFGVSSAAEHLTVELDGPDREPVAYLARPFFPVLDLADVGPVGLGIDHRSQPESARLNLLKPADTQRLRYGDGVRVLSAAISAHGRPGEPVALAMSWVGDAVLPSELVWNAALVDPRGRDVARGTGLRHAISAEELVVSWFTLGLPAESPEGAYTVRVRREDQVGADFDVGKIDVVRG